MLDPFRFRYNGLELKASGLLGINPKLLRLGAILYFGVSSEPPEDAEGLEVKSGYDHSFTSVSNTPLAGAVKLRIYHVSWNSKVVLLIGRYEAESNAIFKQVEMVCSRSEFDKRLESLMELPDD